MTMRIFGVGRMAGAAAGAALASALLMSGAAGAEAVCQEGDETARIACLAEKVAALEERLGEMDKALEDKAEKRAADEPGREPEDDIVRYGNAVIIRNQDMRIFPRCLDNPGPDMPNQLSAVMATSCAPAAGQTWIMGRPMH